MRLIDVDAYMKKICTYNLTGCGSCKAQTICPVDEPTVEAIPMDWIMKYYEDHPAGFVTGMIYDWAMEQSEGKDEYVTLHHEDIHFIDEDAERAFYESLAEEILEDDWDD